MVAKQEWLTAMDEGKGVRPLELNGSAGPGVAEYERGNFCVCKFFVSD